MSTGGSHRPLAEVPTSSNHSSTEERADNQPGEATEEHGSMSTSGRVMGPDEGAR